MAYLKGFLNFIIGVILFGLIFSLLFIRETNKIVSSNVLKESVKGFVNDISDNDMELTESQKEAIDDVFEDKEAKDIISLILENYKGYRNNSNYSISDEDANTFYEYIHKYRNDIKDSKIENMTEEEFEEYFNKDKINEMAGNLFERLDKVFDSKTLDRILDGYVLATSYFVRLTILFVIIFLIFLLCLINVSLIKWMVTFGISLIASGCLFNLLYAGAETVKDLLLKDKININIDLGSFLFAGIMQVVLGVILIIIYNVLKNRKNEDVAIK